MKSDENSDEPRHESAAAAPSRMVRVRRFVRKAMAKALMFGERLPPGVRSLVGLVLIGGGVLGFLPVLGFWMLPMGVAILSIDVPPLRRRLEAWVRRAP